MHVYSFPYTHTHLGHYNSGYCATIRPPNTAHLIYKNSLHLRLAKGISDSNIRTQKYRYKKLKAVRHAVALGHLFTFGSLKSSLLTACLVPCKVWSGLHGNTSTYCQHSHPSYLQLCPSKTFPLTCTMPSSSLSLCLSTHNALPLLYRTYPWMIPFQAETAVR